MKHALMLALLIVCASAAVALERNGDTRPGTVEGVTSPDFLMFPFE